MVNFLVGFLVNFRSVSSKFLLNFWLIPAREARGFSKNVASKRTNVRPSVRPRPLLGSCFAIFSRFWVFWNLSFQSRFAIFGTSFALELRIFAFPVYESATGFIKSADLALMFAVFCLLFRVGANPGPAAGTPNVRTMRRFTVSYTHLTLPTIYSV